MTDARRKWDDPRRPDRLGLSILLTVIAAVAVPATIVVIGFMLLAHSNCDVTCSARWPTAVLAGAITAGVTALGTGAAVAMKRQDTAVAFGSATVVIWAITLVIWISHS